MRENYFGRVLNSLNTECTRKNFELDFVTLKSYEYWIRMMRICKSYPDADDCIAIISKERASRVLKDLSEASRLTPRSASSRNRTAIMPARDSAATKKAKK